MFYRKVSTPRPAWRSVTRVPHKNKLDVIMISHNPSRRSFLESSAALLAWPPFIAGSLASQFETKRSRLIAYVGTFSSPLRDVLPTQVDRPDGNGRGIHLFSVDPATGAMAPAGIQEMGTSPSCLAVAASGTHLYSSNETDHVGRD